MKKIKELNLGFTDAQIYSQRKNKAMFNDIFVKNLYLDELVQHSKFFLIGEKGTGKTAYATFLSNGEYYNTKSVLKFLSSTDYDKFYILKEQKNLDLTGYTSIWKVIILLLFADSISNDSSSVATFNKSSIGELNKAINEYYQNAFAPNIMTALKVIEQSNLFASLLSKHIEAGGNSSKTIEFLETKFQTNLLYIEKQFIEAISKIRLTKDMILFIDGIDIRPDNIPYSDYIECIRGLANATWSLNTEVFQNMKGKGNCKTVLLLRPDIYNSLSLQNATNKLLDNSVYLDWRTTYRGYKKSYLYNVAKKILSYDNERSELCDDELWNAYFPWKIRSTNEEEREFDTAFMSFLRISLSRPRDILVILQYLQKLMLRNDLGESLKFSFEEFNSNEFQNSYSTYFMGSLKDQLLFYYSSIDFQHFLKFFDYFHNTDFSYKTYLDNYEKFIEYICNNASDIPAFMEEPKKLLQLLYDSNVIAAIDNGRTKPYFYFSYREKDISNINPQVPVEDNITYRFHYGMYKKAEFGRF